MPADIQAQRRPLVLDGGLSNVLEALGCDLARPLWTAAVLMSDPEAIVRAHLAYLRAGADIITTASYQASVAGFMAAGRSRTEAEALLVRSVELAEQARERFRRERPGHDRKLFIAASIGPYGAYLADGSEYTGLYNAGDAEIREYHEPKIRCLSRSGADLLAFETLPSLREIAILADLVRDVDVPAWFSFCCPDSTRLHDGTPLSEAIETVKHLSGVFALGANCTGPMHIADIIRRVKAEAPARRVVVYPNSGEVYDAATGTWSGIRDPDTFRRMAGEWIALGADIVGGCCRVGPVQIASLRSLLATSATLSESPDR